MNEKVMAIATKGVQMAEKLYDKCRQKRNAESEMEGKCIESIKNSMPGFFTKDISEKTVDNNMLVIGKVVKKIVPVTMLTAAAFFIAPPLAGAAAFSLAGAEFSGCVYAATNIVVLGTGACKLGNSLAGEKDKEQTNSQHSDSNVVEFHTISETNNQSNAY